MIKRAYTLNHILDLCIADIERTTMVDIDKKLFSIDTYQTEHLGLVFYVKEIAEPKNSEEKPLDKPTGK